jgi:predicted ATPase
VLPELLVEDPELAVPPPLSEGWQRHHFFEALARTILKCPQPLLLVIDDLQWCDQETLEWLHYLLRLEPQARFLVAGSVRIEDLNDRHALRALMHDLNRDGCSTEIPLGLLNSKDTASLATQVFGRQLDAESSVELYRETEGHPLFIIESVRAGLLSSTKDSTASEKPEFAQVQRTSILPPKVHAVLSARLAQLSSRAQDLTSLAACISRPFTAELLQKASHWDEETLMNSGNAGSSGCRERSPMIFLTTNYGRWPTAN